MITVLMLASSPIDQGPLRLGKELKVIKHSLDIATNRDQFRIISCTASTVDDLRRYLVECNPTIVHFSGHGAGAQGLCFEAEDGTTHPVNGERLAKLFHLVNDSVKCVIMNACYSSEQAAAISREIDFVIGMTDAIEDPAAIKFSQGFYEALWAGQSFDKSFKFGCSAIDTANMPQECIPKIMLSPRLGGRQLSYSEETQNIENFILAYCNSDADSRAAMSIDGMAMLPMIKDRMKVPSFQSWTSVSVLSMSTNSCGYLEAASLVRSGLDNVKHTFYIKNIRGELKIDWEATMGHWPIPFKTFKALASNKIYRVRVIASLDDYFNGGYEKENFVSVKLEHIDGHSIWGYAFLTNGTGQRLIDHLYDGRAHRIILDIKPRNGDTSHVYIGGFVSDCWTLLEGHSEPAQIP